MVKTVITLLVIVCVLASISSFLAAKFTNQQEILRAKQELEDIRALRDSLLTQVGQRDSVISDLEQTNKDLETEANALRVERAELEEQRRKAEAAAFRLFQPEEYMEQLREIYPEFANSGWGFKEVFNEKYRIEIEYFLIPTQFTTAFIQDHIDAVSYREQRDKLLQVDSLAQVVSTYKDSIITLERENKEAYKKGYDDAYARYDTLNQKYVKLLENPQVRLGIPSVTAILGSAGAGFLLGTIVK